MSKRMTRYVRLARARAMTLAELRSLNQRIEREARVLRAKGAEPPLDGYTSRLGGTDAEPGLSGIWLEAYIERAIEANILNPDELDEAA
jgi:hypothetical protein